MSKQTAQNLNLLGDCIILVAASVAATKLPGDQWHWLVFIGMAASSILVWAVGGRVLRHYDIANGRGIRSDVGLTVILVGLTLVVMWGLHLVIPRFAAGSQLARFEIVVVPCVMWLRLTVNWLRGREVPIEEVLLIGIGPLGRHTGLEIRDRNDHRRVLGYLRFADEPTHSRLPADVLGFLGDLEGVLKKHVVSEVFIAGNNDSQRIEMQGAIAVLERFGIPFALPVSGFRFGRARPAHEQAIADGYVHYLSVRHKPFQSALKRLFDMGSSMVGLVLLAPLMVGVAVAIKVTSRGPILFKQRRVGQHSKPFHMLKFRSMVVNAEELKAKLMAQN